MPSGYTSLVCLGSILDVLRTVWFNLGDWGGCSLSRFSLLVYVSPFIFRGFEFLSLWNWAAKKGPLNLLHSFYNEEESMVLQTRYLVWKVSKMESVLGVF